MPLFEAHKGKIGGKNGSFFGKYVKAALFSRSLRLKSVNVLNQKYHRDITPAARRELIKTLILSLKPKSTFRYQIKFINCYSIFNPISYTNT
jgi:hypothetical protein